MDARRSAWKAHQLQVQDHAGRRGAGSTSAPDVSREVNTSDERLDDGKRSWGTRTRAEFATQALRGGRFATPEFFWLEGIRTSTLTCDGNKARKS